MVTFDEMRREQVALKQQVEKLNENFVELKENVDSHEYTEHQFANDAGSGILDAQQIYDWFDELWHEHRRDPGYPHADGGIVSYDPDETNSLLSELRAEFHEGTCSIPWVDWVINMVKKLDQNNLDMLKKFNEFNATTNTKLAELETKINGVDTALEKQYSRVRVDIESNKAEVGNTVYHMDRDRATLIKRLDVLADRLSKLEGSRGNVQDVEQKVDVEYIGAREFVKLINESNHGPNKINLRDFMDSLEWKRYITHPHTKGKTHKRGVTEAGVKSGLVVLSKYSTGTVCILYNKNMLEEAHRITQAYMKSRAELICEGAVDDE